MKTITTFLILFALPSLAAMAYEDRITYPSFQAGSSHFVFPDFQEAHYSVVYDVQNKKTYYEAVITLDTKESGKILFDAVVDPVGASLDGQAITTPVIQAPNKVTKYRYTSADSTAGHHVLKVQGQITRLVKYEGGGVHSAYWLNDIYDRSYLENYLPSSFEYDRVKMVFSIRVVGSNLKHAILTNGTVQEIASNSYTVTYPEYYNTSSIFFHLLPENRIQSEQFLYQSIDGRKLPAIVYFPLAPGAQPTSNGATMLHNYRTTLVRKLNELERDFGHFLHSQILVYATSGGGFPGIGGMEYCGATMTNLRSLPHETTHSYFGRGIVPSNGNAGWLDEALTTWGDQTGYATSNSSSIVNPSSMFTQGPFVRTTNEAAYNLGVTFMSQLAGHLKQKGEKPFVQFLNYLLQNHAFEPYTNEDFWKWSKDYYGYNLLDLVQKNSSEFYTEESFSNPNETNDIHHRFTDEELMQLL